MFNSDEFLRKNLAPFKMRSYVLKMFSITKDFFYVQRDLLRVNYRVNSFLDNPSILTSRGGLENWKKFPISINGKTLTRISQS